MESIVIFIFFVILTIIVFNGTLDNNTIDIPKKDTSGHVKPEHLLYDLLKQYSSGDKLYLAGKCKVNLYSKYIIPAEMKREFTNLLNRIFQSVYKVTNNLFQVQEINYIY